MSEFSYSFIVRRWLLLAGLVIALSGCVFDGAPLTSRQCASDVECPEEGEVCVEGYCRAGAGAERQCQADGDCAAVLDSLADCQSAVCSDDGLCVVGQLQDGIDCGQETGCQRGACRAGVCFVTPDDTRCDDGLFCNGAEVCAPADAESDERGCLPGAGPALEDGVECTVGRCDEESGAVEQDCAACECCGDTAGCGGAPDQCFEWTCTQGFECLQVAQEVGSVCDDGLPCTEGDSCDGAQVCAGQPSDALCDDGLFCNGVEVCDPSDLLRDDAGCLVGPSEVDDGIECTVDTCDEDSDTIAHDPSACVCTQDSDCVAVCRRGLCDGGLCVFEAQPAGTGCDDGVACTSGDTCDEAQSCAGTPDSGACDDGVFCNGDEVCSANEGGCVSVARVLDDGVQCTVDSCDEAEDRVVNDAAECGCAVDGDCVQTCMVGVCGGDLECVFTPAPNGSACDDGVACTSDDLCDAQQRCAGLPDAGLCQNGVFCDGSELCDPSSAQSDDAGCVASDDVVVDDGIDCTTDSCDELGNRVINDPIGCECSNDQDCVAVCQMAQCTNFSCQFRPAPEGTPCDDGLDCTVNEECSTERECVGVADDTRCDDEAYCNGDERCAPDQDGADPQGCVEGEDPLLGVETEACEVAVCNEETDEVEFEGQGEPEGPYFSASCFDTLDNDCNDSVDGQDPLCAFAPETLGSLRLWLDAAAAQSFELQTDNRVRRWSDLSSEGNDAVASGDERPQRREDQQNGQATVSFNGDFRLMEIENEGRFDARSELTVFVVFRSDGFEDDYEALLTKGDNSWRLHRQGTSNSIALHAETNGGAVRLASTSNVNDGLYHLVTGRADSGEYGLWVDGVLEAEQTSGDEINRNNERVNLCNNTDFNGRKWDGKLAEVLVFLSALSDEDRQNVETYLQLKWGL